MGNLVDSGFYGLALAHALLQGDPVFLCMKISLCIPVDLLISDRHRGDFRECLHKILIIFHTSGQFTDTNVRQFLPFRLRHIKDRDNTKSRDFYFHFLDHRHPVFIQHKLPGHRISLFLFFLYLIRCGCKDTDPLFPTLYMAVKVFLPCLIACNKCGIRLLHGDQHGIVQTVMMEF